MEVTLIECDHATIVQITGSVDGLNAEQLSASIAAPIAAGRRVRAPRGPRAAAAPG